jgi:hypothetical protein
VCDGLFDGPSDLMNAPVEFFFMFELFLVFVCSGGGDETSTDVAFIGDDVVCCQMGVKCLAFRG